MILIGELINCTRKRIRAAVEAQDAAYIQQIARKQADAGAAVLDVNGGIAGRELECLTWLVDVVQEVTDLPLCLDSSDPAAIRAALKLCKQAPMINSITDEAARWNGLLPVIREHKLKTIALCMSDSGTPGSVEDRINTASRLVDRLTAEGLALDDIFVDACVMPVSAEPDGGRFLAEAIGCITARYPGIHTSVGLSNVSFGLPVRKLLNQTYLVLLMARGLDAAIADPCDEHLMRSIFAAEALLARDEYCASYLRAYRKGKLEPLAVAAS
jgi:5-methyltetrahydrofolate--homocysteine methyltransferase